MRPFTWPLARVQIAGRVRPASARSKRLDIHWFGWQVGRAIADQLDELDCSPISTPSAAT
jgi:hypothetical protein